MKVLIQERPVLVNHLRHRFGDIAEDLFQDVAIKILKEEANITHPRSWIYQTAKNAGIDYCKLKKNQTVALAEDIPAQGHSIDDRIDVRQALGTLDPYERALLSVRYIDEYKGSDIARKTNTQPYTINKHLRRAREKMRTSLGY